MQTAWTLTLNQYVCEHHTAFSKSSHLYLPLGFSGPQSPHLWNGPLGAKALWGLSQPCPCQVSHGLLPETFLHRSGPQGDFTQPYPGA